MMAHESNGNLARRARPSRLAAGIATALVLLAVRAQAGVTRVSGSEDALSNAVNAAVDGDTLIVMAGSYDGFRLEGKGLSIVAASAGTVTVGPAIVRNVPAGHDTVISGLSFPDGLQILSCTCAVRLQSVVTGPGPAAPVALPGLDLSLDSDVALIRCTLQGKYGVYGHATATSGVDASSSNVALYDCLVQGGAGLGSFLPYSAGAGGNGLSAIDSTVMTSNSQFIGGQGGNGGYYACNGESGGDGIRFHGSTTAPAICYLRDCGERAGVGGSLFPNGNCHDGENGLPLDFTGAAVFAQFPAVYRALQGPGVVHENTEIPLVFSGVPGDRVSVYYSNATQFELSVPFQGVFLFGTPARSARMGTIPATGTLNTTLHVDALGPGVEACTRYVQAIFVDRTDVATLGSPAIIEVVGSGF
jgi:hypothetical protein